MKRFLLGVLAAFSLSATACAGQAAAPQFDLMPSCDVDADPTRLDLCVQGAVMLVLNEQVAAWNRGDIPGFMQHYWKSENLRFASGGDITTGWAPTLERYLTRYDTVDKMGTLSFEILDIDVVGPEAALVFGAWKLRRDADEPHGLFTLTFKVIDERWVIVADHTSSAD